MLMALNGVAYVAQMGPLVLLARQYAPATPADAKAVHAEEDCLPSSRSEEEGVGEQASLEKAKAAEEAEAKAARAGLEEAVRKAMRTVRASHAALALVLSYLVAPVVALKLLGALDCAEVVGRRVLRIDTAIDCDDPG